MEIYETPGKNGANIHWLLSLIILVLLVFGSLALLQGIAILLVPLLFEIPLDELFALFSSKSNHPNARLALLFIQGFGGGLGFLLGGYIYHRLIDKATLVWRWQFARARPLNLLLVVPVLAGFVMFNSLFAYINMGVEFPAFLSELEQMLKSKEEELMQLTLYLTDFGSFTEFLLGLVVIGILPGIGEEYLFRGVLQPKLRQFTNNAHLGVWLAALVFSAIHLQFYGFLPRLLLGALFGYLYLYSGSLVYPIVAHALNNSIIVVVMYLNKIGWIEYDITGIESVEWVSVLLGVVIFTLSFGLFKKNNTDNGKVAENF